MPRVPDTKTNKNRMAEKTFYDKCMDIVIRFRKEVAQNKCAWVDMGFKELDSAFQDEAGALSGEEMAQLRFSQKIILKDFIMQRYKKTAEEVPLEAVEIILGGIGKEGSKLQSFHWDGEKAVEIVKKLSKRQPIFDELTRKEFADSEIHWGDDSDDGEDDGEDDDAEEESGEDEYESDGINDASEISVSASSGDDEGDADDDITTESDETPTPPIRKKRRAV
jgi:hypothetical protein